MTIIYEYRYRTSKIRRRFAYSKGRQIVNIKQTISDAFSKDTTVHLACNHLIGELIARALFRTGQ